MCMARGVKKHYKDIPMVWERNFVRKSEMALERSKIQRGGLLWWEVENFEMPMSIAGGVKNSNVDYLMVGDENF